MKGSSNDNNSTSQLVAVAAVVGFALGANYGSLKAWLGYYFPHLILNRNHQRSCEPTTEELLAIAEEIIQGSLYGKPGGSSLIASVDETGAPRVRAINPMIVSLRDGITIHNSGLVTTTESDDNTVPKAVFFTNRQSRKHTQFQNDPRAELIYLEPLGISSVRLAGTCHEMPLHESKKLWQPRMSGFIQEGPRGRYITYEFRFHRIEVVSVKHGLATTERKDWQPYTLLLQLSDDESKDGQVWVYQKTMPEQRL